MTRLLLVALIAAAVCMAGAGVGAADDYEQVVFEPCGLQMPELHEGYVWTGVPLWGVAQDATSARVMQKWVYGGLPSTPAFTTTQAVQTPTAETRNATSERYPGLWLSRYIDAFEVEVASTPAITSISPSQPTVSPTKQWISVRGTGFVSDSTVTLRIGSSTYPIPSDRTDFRSSTEIKVRVGLTDTGTWTVQVTNPGSKKSNIFSFTVKPDIPTPAIIVSTNLDQATFTITGPKTYHDSGKSWSTSDAPAGTYTITYGEVSGYATPSSETDTLSAGGSITFSGTYLYSGNGELGVKAANLAMQVVGAPYLWGGKGWDYVEMEFVDSPDIKSGYYYWNPTAGQVDWGQGLDCSGLSFWSYNKAAGATKHTDSSNPIYYEGASGQWNDGERFEQISTAIPTVSDLKIGDLLFLDADPDGVADHVGMYVGNGDVIHAKGSASGVGVVERKTLSEWLDLPLPGAKKYRDHFVGYGRVKDTTPQSSSLPPPPTAQP